MYSGLTAKLTIETDGPEKELGYISNFNIEETRDMIEIAKLGNMNKEKMPSTFSWTASADGAADFSSESGHKDLHDAMLNGTKVNATFYLDLNTYLTGSAYVDSFSVDISSDDKANVSISLSGSGPLTLNTNIQPTA